MHPTEAILILCHIKSYLCFMFRNKLSVREQSETDSRNSDVSDEINYIYIYRGNTQHWTRLTGHISPLKVHTPQLSGRGNYDKRRLITLAPETWSINQKGCKFI